MWILTILLLFASGEVKAVSMETDRSIAGHACMAAAQDAWKLSDMGFHVVAATCYRAREA